MPKKPEQPQKFRVTLKDPGSEQRRFVTLSRVPCPTCKNDPVARGGFELVSGAWMPECGTCDGRGEVPATRESAAAYLEDVERQRVLFRLDDPLTLHRYQMTMPANALEIVQQTVLFVPKDTHTVDNRFLRAGKVVRQDNRDPDAPRYEPKHKGWLAFHNQEKPFKVHAVDTGEQLMAVTGYVWGKHLIAQYDGSRVTDWDTNAIKTSLHSALDQATNFDVYDFYDDVVGTEVSGTNYTAGGATLTTPTVTNDTGTDQVRCDGDNTSWASSTISATDSVTYNSTGGGTNATRPLLTSLDFGATVSTTAGTFQITWDATGILVFDYT